MSILVQLKQIIFHSDLVSKPVRDNFADIENALNNLQDQFNAILTAASGAEVVNARDYHAVLRDRIRSGGQALKRNTLITGGVVTINGGDTAKVDISAGEAIINGVGCKWSAQTSAAISPTSSGNHRVAVVVANSDNTISILDGGDFDEITDDPLFPSIADSQLSLYALYISDAGIVDLTEEIYKLKEDDPFYPNIFRTVDHTLTENKNVNNLILRNVSVDCGAFFYLCQGYAHANGCSSTPAQATGEVTNSQLIYRNSNSVYQLVNYDGTVLNGSGGAGSPGKGENVNLVYAGSPGVNGKTFKIKALGIFITNGLLSSGQQGAHGVTERDVGIDDVGVSPWVVGQAFVGASGGDAGDGAEIYLECVEDLVQDGDIEASGAVGGDGLDANSGSIANLGGTSGDGGDGGPITIKCRNHITTDTLISNGGSPGAFGVGSGGSDNNGNGDSGTIGTSGPTSVVEWDLDNPLPAGYGDWFRRYI